MVLTWKSGDLLGCRRTRSQIIATITLNVSTFIRPRSAFDRQDLNCK